MRNKPRFSEHNLELEIAEWLESTGVKARRQPWLESGIPDIMTDDWVIEVKHTLTRQNIFQATGQMLIYIQDYPEKRGMILGLESTSIVSAKAGELLLPYVRRLGLAIEYWAEDKSVILNHFKSIAQRS